jgi:hypothetical protein
MPKRVITMPKRVITMAETRSRRFPATVRDAIDPPIRPLACDDVRLRFAALRSAGRIGTQSVLVAAAPIGTPTS